MIATWEPEPPRSPMPGLPRCGAPRPLVLPISDVLRTVDECLRDDGLDKTGAAPPAEPADCARSGPTAPGAAADEADSPEAAAGLCGGTGGVPDREADDEELLPQTTSFQRLLRDLAAEHRRALARARLEAAGAAEAGAPPAHLGAPPADLGVKFAGPPEEMVLEEVPPEGPALTQRSRTQSSEVFLTDGELSSTGAPRGESAWRGSRGMLSVRSSLFDAHSESTKGSGSDSGRRSPPLREADAVLEGSCGRLLARMKVVVKSQAFDCINGVAIVLNAFQLGWSANYSVVAAVEGRPPDMLPFSSQLATVFFTVWFATELLLKFVVSGPREFFASEADGRWNIFDTLVVGSDLVHTLLEMLSVEVADGLGIQNLTVVRMIRILRITRVVRVVRLIRFFRELRMMVLSVLRAGASLFWSLLLLSVTIYVFGVYFCQIVAYHVYEETVLDGGSLQSQEVLLDMFGNLLRAEYILYQAIAGGLNWGDIGKQLMEIHPFHVFSLAFFTFFTTFALLNIITGIFVQTSITNAQNDRDDMIQEQMHQTEIALKEMKRIFQSADLDASGALTLPEFEVHLKNPEVRAHLGSIGIEISRAKGIFRLLDLDMSGEINIEEFVNGCMKLKGNARSVDLAMLMYESLTLAQEWRNFAEWSEQQFAQVSDFERRIEDKLSVLLGERY